MQHYNTLYHYNKALHTIQYFCPLRFAYNRQPFCYLQNDKKNQKHFLGKTNRNKGTKKNLNDASYTIGRISLVNLLIHSRTNIVIFAIHRPTNYNQQK